jgi:DNA-binding NarL/FixJ family response regulator
VIADDHGIVLDGLRRILQPEFEVVASAADGRELVSYVAKFKPDLVIADISMPELSGLEALRQCKLANSHARFVFLTGSADVTLAAQALRLGASGYVLKQGASDELVAAMREALANRIYISPRIADEVWQRLMSHAASTRDGAGLTRREREVLQLLAEGKIMKEIAVVLGVSPRTAEFHKNNIMTKTGMRTTAELARFAARCGLVSEPPH